MTILKRIITSSLSVLLSLFFFTCIDPIEPEFVFKDGLIFIEAFASTSEGASFVSVRETVLNNNRYSTNFIEGAQVSFTDNDTGEVVPLVLQADVYAPAADFVANVGELWSLDIILPDGRKYQSLPEKVLAPVSMKSLKSSYNSELVFNEALKDFVPGHAIEVSLDDPENDENYYYWRFRSFEKQDYCKRCSSGILRNGICVENPPDADRKDFYDYLCDSDCWRIRFSQNINIFSDKFTNGSAINDLKVAEVLLFDKTDILVEVQQFSLSPEGYDYYKILQDIVDNNSGLNAPPPAALIGNVFNTNDTEEYVLGRFTAAATSTKSIFIPRVDINEEQIERRVMRQFEDCGEVCPPEKCLPGAEGEPCFEIRGGAKCQETRFSTAIAPEGWIEQ